MKPKTRCILGALIFAAVATACSSLTMPLGAPRDDPFVRAWTTIHLPAMFSYIGTLAEHDPSKGGGLFLFISLQWSVVGWMITAFIHDEWAWRFWRRRMGSTSASEGDRAK